MAGSLRDGAETKLLQLLFNNTTWADFSANGDDLVGTTAAGTFEVALYTVAPADNAAGTECDYTGYAKVAVARTAGGWTVSGNNVSNAAAINFPACTGGDADTAVAFAILTPDGEMIIWGDITAPVGGLVISTGITPSFAIGELDVNVD